MEKSATLNLRVNPEVKREAEQVLRQLGIPMATAIEMYLRQVSLTGGIPFRVALPKAPAALDMGHMSAEQLHAELAAGLDDVKAGRVMNAAEVFERFRSERA
ncbi:MAG: type II toxin-antitoxin system RelB/DinJ family antitoxin [Clostridia bacterium]|nr:type II toxin-antitoxin system RelB/DinJ family antitoxin [Clostridia bacterium]